MENLSKTIDGVKILDNISFTLGREDKVALVAGTQQQGNAPLTRQRGKTKKRRRKGFLTAFLRKACATGYA